MHARLSAFFGMNHNIIYFIKILNPLSPISFQLYLIKAVNNKRLRIC